MARRDTNDVGAVVRSQREVRVTSDPILSKTTPIALILSFKCVCVCACMHSRERKVGKEIGKLGKTNEARNKHAPCSNLISTDGAGCYEWCNNVLSNQIKQQTLGG